MTNQSAPPAAPPRPMPERVISDREWEIIKALRATNFARTSRPQVFVLNWTGTKLIPLETSQVT